MPAILCITQQPDPVNVYRQVISHPITHVHTPIQGREAYRESHFDVVILDATTDSAHYLETIPAFNNLPSAPCVITIVDDEQKHLTALKRGATHSVVKSDTMYELLGVLVERCLQSTAERKRQREELDIFSAAVAHDLRQPVTTVLTSLHLLRHFHSKQMSNLSIVDPDIEMRYLRHANNIENASYALNHTISRARILAQLRSGADVDFEGVNMNATISRLLQELQHTITELGASVHCAENLPPAFGESTWIEAVWFNYIHNALDHGGEPPKIWISADHPESGAVRYMVQDNGDEIDLSTPLFPALQPLHEKRFRGYGLVMVRAVVERMNGTVNVESSSSGNIFSFTLPAAR